MPTKGRERRKMNGLAPGDQVLVKQKKENKLSTTFGDVPYKVTKNNTAMKSH